MKITNSSFISSVLRALLALICLFTVSTVSFATNTEFWKQSDEGNTKVIDHQPWQMVLEHYLISNRPSKVNRFRYSEVSEKDKQSLKKYLSTLQAIDPRQYKKVEQMAYWINLYNALTVDLILDNYPVKSIKKTGESFLSFGPWDDELVVIAKQRLSLNDIEHKILRPIWKDPRIHYVVNCASYGCPNLSAKVFTAANMDTLLDKAAYDYINHTRGVNFIKGKLIVSSIYHWYKEDFGDSDALLIKHLSHYAKPKLKQRLSKYQGVVDHQYDWRLNEPNNTY